MTEAGSDPGRDEYLSWEAFRRRMEEAQRPEAGRAAGVWAIDQLAARLGTDWLKGVRGRDGSMPTEILGAEFHVVAFGELLDLALRLHLLHGAEGMGNVRKELARDMRLDRRVHTRAMLGIAARAQQLGWGARLEARLASDLDPTDVVIAAPSGTIACEVFAVLTDEVMREAMVYTDDLVEHIRRICWGHRVEIDGTFDGPATADETAAWIAEVERVAAEVALDGRIRVVDAGSGRVEVMSMKEGMTRGTSFTGPIMGAKGPARLDGILRKKAEQAAAAGAKWICTDVMDGLWQFTSLAGLGLHDKGEAIAAQVHLALAQVAGIDGAVLTSGAGMAQGEFIGESARLQDGGFVLRRPFAPARVRETVIVPLRSESSSAAAEWCELYDGEPEWLDWALCRVELPPADVVFGPPPATP